MQINWDDMRTILALVRAGSLAGAAQALSVSYTTVARRVQRAEDMVGRPLFERRPDGYLATTEAEELAAAARRMEQAEQSALRNLSGADQSLAGELVLTAPQLLIQSHLAPFLAEFCATHPEIALTVRATNNVLDLTRREADLAIRISKTPGDTLVGLHLADQKTACVARPDLLAQAVADPEAPLDWVIYSGYDAPPKAALQRYPNYRIRARFDDMTSLIAAAKAGMGAVRMPVYLGRSDPDLEPLPGIAPQDYAPIWVLSHQDLLQSAKVRHFKRGLKRFFRSREREFTSFEQGITG
ncbi:LysR family transcriptional regulator [Phaeobacter inhibens]|uniref:Transcriptional regulator, LysR family n=1 Tax=Phaeobacter inhibens TaxID=221822 RepID=A0A2I7KBP9_9RHOB|nr:LysR family transcriptional regulator [Phaeobacter inhibens]AUQ99940.1 transcriptional regulator, LysR family [Phaeobacter inhibens]